MKKRRSTLYVCIKLYFLQLTFHFVITNVTPTFSVKSIPDVLIVVTYAMYSGQLKTFSGTIKIHLRKCNYQTVNIKMNVSIDYKKPL